jgi:hypothetical protein
MANKTHNIDLNASCKYYNNVSQGIINITEDKLKVILLDNENKNKKFYSWTTPLGVFISCLIATITSNFNKTWGLSPDTWMAIFVIVTVGSGIWFILSIYRALKNRDDRGIDHLIEVIKNTEVK